MSDKKKIGRPTEELKAIKITVRISEEANNILEKYSKEKGISKADSVRKAIESLPISKK